MSHLRRLNAHLKRTTSYNYRTLRSQPWNELSGAMGDLGTFLPLTLALSLTHSISLPATLLFSGLANILTGAVFALPLPVQPMKALAAWALASHATQGQMAAAGIMAGAIVLALSATGAVRLADRAVPRSVVAGVQVAAGIALLQASARQFAPLSWIHPYWADNYLSTILAFVGLLACAALATKGVHVPYALGLVVLGLTIAGARHGVYLSPGVDLYPRVPREGDFRAAWPAVLAQVPLTVVNSLIAAAALGRSLLPEHPANEASAERLGWSVGVMNLVGCWFGVMPVCHGAGGLAGQVRFGARSGGSVVVLGLVKVLLGVLGGSGIRYWFAGLPGGWLGVLVAAAGVEIMSVGIKRVEGPEVGVMLATVAGRVGFGNDGVGVLVGLAWFWGMRVPEWWERRQKRATSEEEESLLG
ncbi:hypothetical protein EJ06DRAFT_150578 [Trichodelitschia bisporula]|uniref:Sulfate transporter n=1 Tax=Trichodelitschia bisporula TaxID=703511 RepID=A0A6G1HNJ2_9PEZI|nr:hypothetical protein EJ06DRAFT_150578 [Trichodelitschia bisporula]